MDWYTWYRLQSIKLSPDCQPIKDETEAFETYCCLIMLNDIFFKVHPRRLYQAYLRSKRSLGYCNY